MSSIDDLIREALTSEPESEPAPPHDFRAIRRRARSRRMLAGLGGAAAAAIVVALSTLLISTPDRSGFARDGAGRAFDELVGYSIAVPPGWDVAVRPGDGAALFPEGSEGPADDPTMTPVSAVWLRIEVDRLRRFDDWVSHHRVAIDAASVRGARVTEEERSIDSRDARLFTIEYPDSGAVGPDACDGCRVIVAFIDWPGEWDLRVTGWASDEATMRDNRELLRGVMTSLSASTSPEGSSEPVGTFAPPLAVDAVALGLKEFLDRRIDGEGAEIFLREDAATAYETHTGAWSTRLYHFIWLSSGDQQCEERDGVLVCSGEFTLDPRLTLADPQALAEHGRGVNEEPFYRWEVMDREEGPGGSRFLVRMFWSDVGSTESFAAEWIRVRAGADGEVQVVEMNRAGEGMLPRPDR